MGRFITTDDFTDTWSKLRQRGARFLLSKLSPKSSNRTISAFNEWDIEGSNWWMIPQVQQRWNEKITGDSQTDLADYLVQRYLQPAGSGRLLSVGSGTCTKEFSMAVKLRQWQFVCTDIAPRLMQEAKAIAATQQLHNISFHEIHAQQQAFPHSIYDVIFFHSSLHHFPRVYHFLQQKILPVLAPGGLLIVFEYTGPNRLQFPDVQIKAINKLLQTIPPAWRTRYKTKQLKNTVSGPGLIRMILADPSECVDAAAILPALHELCEVVEEKPVGDNLLMLLLKDIAHHFQQPDATQRAILQRLFNEEDQYLQQHKADFLFGVYRKKRAR